MLRKPRLLLTCLLPVLLFAGSVSARNVFLLPNSSSTSPLVSVIQPESNIVTTTFTAQSAASAVLSHPTLNKYYILAKAASDTVIVVDGTNFSNITKRLNLGQGQAFAISPDGRRLVVVGDSTYIIDTATDNVIATITDTGTSPIDVAMSLDGSRAFVLSSVSNRLTAIDLNTNTVVGSTVAISGNSNGVAVGPNGFVYVSATNRLFVIDGKAMTIRNEIPLNARPGKVVFTSDGRYAVAVNETPLTGSTALLFDLASNSLSSTIPNIAPLNPALSSLVVASDNRVYGLSNATQQIYVMSLNPFNIDVGQFGSIGTINNVSYIAATNELPSPKYMFVTTPTSLYRIDLQSNPPNGAGQLNITSNIGGLTFAAQTATGTPTKLIGYNILQSTSVGGTYTPLIIRALDNTGRPLQNVPITFSSDNSGATIQGASVQTNGFGYAQTTVIAPSTSGASFKVTATAAGGALTQDFTLSVGGSTGGGGGTVASLIVVDGNGQFALENFPLAVPLTTKVVDLQGNPVSGQTVTYTITQGSGTMLPNVNGISINAVCTGITCTSVTDVNGIAQAGMLASLVLPGNSYSQTTVSATNGTASVNFVVTTVTGVNPTAVRLAPLDGVELSGPAGSTIKGAIQIRVVASGGQQQGQPIPNIGLSAKTFLNDPLLGPTASCAGGAALTDATGLATCDLVLGGKLGVDQLKVSIGSALSLGGAGINLRVLPGLPSRITLRQGNNQSGNPGAQLPLAFLAEINDAFGNVLPGQTAQFEIVDAGSITLRNQITVADANGRISALGTLGNAPGPHLLRVRSGTITAAFTFTVNVNVTQLTAVTGDGQTATVGSAFTQSLSVKLLDDRNAPVANAGVAWSISSGSGTLSSATTNTDTNGIASVNVTAGAQAGALTVRASYSNLATSFNLSVRLLGPVFTANSIVNAASNTPGIAPCGLVNIFGTNLVPRVQGTVLANFILGGPLPTILQGVEVLFDTTNAPIYAVSNVNGQEQITVQAPCSLAPGTTSVTIRNGGLTSVSGVPVSRVQPGIFETSDAATGRRYAVLLRSDGSYVTPNNAARRGDVLRMFATGLGAVSPSTDTNRAGVAGQNVMVTTIVGVNDGGVRVVGASYMLGMIGLYVVDFEVPSDTATGTFRSLALALDGGNGNLIYGQGSSIASIQ